MGKVSRLRVQTIFSSLIDMEVGRISMATTTTVMVNLMMNLKMQLSLHLKAA